jgi:hypothetical protein
MFLDKSKVMMLKSSDDGGEGRVSLWFLSCLLEGFFGFEIFCGNEFSVRSKVLQIVPLVKSTGFSVNKSDRNCKKLALVVFMAYVSNKYSKNAYIFIIFYCQLLSVYFQFPLICYFIIYEVINFKRFNLIIIIILLFFCIFYFVKLT